LATNEDILLQAQAGIETTRGTNVAATRKVYAQITPSFNRPLTAFRNTTGTFHGRRRASYGRSKVAFSASDEATYQDLAWWFKFCLKGGVTATGDGGTPAAYPYIFVPTIATDDLNSMTLEFNESGNPYESGQVMVNSWTLRMDADNDAEPSWMLDLELIGRDWETTTFTGALTNRTTEPILARGTKLYIEDAGGTIGSTQKTGSLISCSISGNNALTYKAFAEDVNYVAANKVGRGEQTFDAQFTFEFDSDTEFAKYRNTVAAQRIIRLEQSGAAPIHTTVYPRMRLDMYGYWSTWSRGTRVNNLTQTFGFMGFEDDTDAKTFGAEVVNASATLV
jgi:hypothetical protein